MAQPKTRTVVLSALAVLILLIVIFAYSTVNSLKQIVPFQTFGDRYFEGPGNIAVMKIEGVILSAEEDLAKIRELAESKNIKAVILRINSPGGAVGPSQEIFDAIIRLRKAKKPVVCSLGDLAASGGFYIAAACDQIVANPGTLTGSIGVIMHFMNLKNLYSWAKVQPNILKAGKYKDIGSDSRDMSDEERKILQDMLNEIHRQFKDAILAGRNADQEKKRLDPKTLEEFADGRVFSGRFAQEKGFVDEIGGEFEAIETAKKLANIKEEEIVREERPRPGLRSLFDAESLVDNLTQNLLSKLSPAQALKLQDGVPYLLPAYFFEMGGGGMRSGTTRSSR